MSVRSWLAATVARGLGVDAVSIFRELTGAQHYTPRLGSTGLLKAYSTSPWLHAIGSRLGLSIASLEWTVSVARSTRSGRPVRFRRLQRGGSTWVQREAIRLALARQKRAGSPAAMDLEPLEDHLLLQVLDAGNPALLGGSSVFEVSQVHLDLIGEGLWVLDRNGLNTPVAIWPMPPTWLPDVPRFGAQTVEIDGPSGRKDVPLEDVIWWKRPDPADPYGRGSGIAMSLADELETDDYAAKHLKSFFRNRARPDLLISGTFDPSMVDRLEQKWLEKLRGLERQHRPFFMAGGSVRVDDLSKSFAELQLVDLRKSERDICLHVYGMPPEIFGILENANRSTIDAADYLYTKFAVLPRAELFRQVLQLRLAPLFDDAIIIDYISPLAEDREHALKVMQAAPWAFTEAEWREAGGRPPLEGDTGDIRMVPAMAMPTRDLGLMADDGDAPAPEPEPPPAAPEPEPEAEEALKLEDEEEAAEGAAKARQPRRAQRLAARAKADDSVIARVVAAIDPEALIRRTRPVILSAVEAFGEQALEELGLEAGFNVRDPRVLAHLRQFAADRITGKVNRTTKEAIRQQLAAGVEAGESTADLVARIQSVFDMASRSRAMLIARTEITRSSNFGTLEGIQQAGVEEKEWLATLDDEVRDTHAELDGQRVAADAPFVSSSGASGLFPGDFGDPAEDCNCRCGVLAVIDEKSLEARKARWKALEADRGTYDRRMARGLRQGFRAQERAAIAALESEKSGGRSAA
jgi:SPP1 gp7 family putative phage head morphogenesis protein